MTQHQKIEKTKNLKNRQFSYSMYIDEIKPFFFKFAISPKHNI
jgi:hypothetical protein